MNRIYSTNETYIKTIDEKNLFNFFKEGVSNTKPIIQSRMYLKSLVF